MNNYSVLELQRPDGQVAALVESVDGSLSIKYAESSHIRKSINHYLKHGIRASIPRNREEILINRLPRDPDFFEAMVRYYSLSFEFVGIVRTMPTQLPIEIKSGSTGGAFKIYTFELSVGLGEFSGITKRVETVSTTFANPVGREPVPFGWA